ncbi:hypothetical protein [Methylophaga sp.]|uniref:hypothetical protein n=1 Tax=Methylophaga sp. TaxID=2024840 RepID=UPI00271AA524|nr:hypothetical protein [Methylophaga sp.]MDO8828122.1 hypothetical protein [Methylophaga sp.]
MKQLLMLLSLSLPLLLTGCGYDEFEGRFIGPDGNISYEFQTDGSVAVVQGEDVSTAEYEYKSNDRIIKLISEQDLPANTLKVKEDGNLEADEMTLTRGVDYAMLDNSTWIGHQGQYTFALTFTMTEQGMETVSELVSYYDENMMYLSQTDDSITRLEGNKLLLDQTQYTVSDVSRESFKISIGENSMVLEKQPKGTEITIRNGYERIDEQL